VQKPLEFPNEVWCGETTLCHKKRPHFCFWNYSVKHEPISVIFGVRNLEETWHQNYINLSTSPEICCRTTLRNSKKWFFEYITHRFLRILRVIPKTKLWTFFGDNNDVVVQTVLWSFQPFRHNTGIWQMDTASWQRLLYALHAKCVTW